MNKQILTFVLIVFLFTFLVSATVITITLNAPDDADVSQNAFRLLNVTANNGDPNELIDIKIYGSNNSIVSNKSLIHRQVTTNGTDVTFNWTSPKILPHDDDGIVLLMYFDNQTGEYLNNVTVGDNTVLLMHMNNDSDVGGNDTLAFDYSDHRNNGTVFNGVFVNTTGKFNASFQFDGNDSFIDVTNETSVNVTNSMSIEGWFYPFGDERTLISTFEYDTSSGGQPSIINVSDEIFAIVYNGGGSDGFIATMNITANGVVTQSTIDTLEFDTSDADSPEIISVGNDIYAIVYDGFQNDGFVTTVNITPSGTIGAAVIDTLEYDTSNGDFPDIISVGNDIYAIIYQGTGSDGFIATVNITPTGTVGNAVVDSFEYETSSGVTPEIISVADDIYAIVYEGAGGDGFVSSINITPTGTITNSLIDTLEFDTSDGSDPHITNVSNDIFAIVYSGVDGDGFVTTVNITAAGTISDAVIDTLEFDTADGLDPRITHISDDFYAIAYNGVDNDGFVKTFQIYKSGAIVPNVLNSIEFDTSDGDFPDIIKVSDGIYAIAYQGGGSDGFIATVDLSTIGKGISKLGSYDLYADTTTAYGSINGQILSAPIIEGWNHLALTFNNTFGSSQQKLYVNGILASTGNLSVNITNTINNLTIGGNYNGTIDEAAIYNKTLSKDEIAEHAGIKLIDESGINNATIDIFNFNGFNYTGKLGPAYKFGGFNNSISINHTSALNTTANFSISFWAYMTDLSLNQTFLSKGSGTTANYYIDFKTTDDNKIEFGFYNGDFRSVSVNASEIAVDIWNLITVTQNDTSNISRVYINAVDKGSLQIDHDVLGNDLDLKVGYFPGYQQNFTGMMDELIIYNKTLNETDVYGIYALKNGTHYWKFSGQDINNINFSSAREFLVGSIWEIDLIDLGSVGATIETEVDVGNLTINNTHFSKNVSINITHDFSGAVTFNTTQPFTLMNNNTFNGSGTLISNTSRIVQINVTSGSTVGTTTINFNVTANDSDTGAESVPNSRIVLLDLVTSQSNPFLITAFETVPTIVSQNNTGINLKASVVNRGQGDAGSVAIQFILPEGWLNATGALNQTLGLLDINQQKNASITVDINASAAAGLVTLFANATGQNDTGVDLNVSFITVGTANVTVNAISAGEGPETEEVAASTGGGAGGGSGAGGVGASSSSPAFSSGVEIVRGEEAKFDIEVKNRFVNSTLVDVKLTIDSEFLPQYISISPQKLNEILYGQAKNFTVTITAPSYKGYEKHFIKATIQGTLITLTGTRPYKETQTITLVIQEVSKEESEDLLEKAREAIKEMTASGFNTKEVNRLLKLAEQKSSSSLNKEVLDLAEQIIKIKDSAFEADELINRVLEALKNPRKMFLITGNVAKDFVDGDGVKRKTRSALTGNAIFGSKSARDILGLAGSAFDRGDYTTALERAQSAQILLILERKGNFGLFVYLYWHLLLIGAALLSVSGVIGYRKYQKSSITKKIEDANNEEDNIKKLTVQNQRDYFSGKISSSEYHQISSEHGKKLVNLRKARLNLRNRRIRLLSREEVIRDLETEKTQVENEIKLIQTAYYVNKKMSEKEYKLQLKALNERIAEIEGERITLSIIRQSKAEKRAEGRLQQAEKQKTQQVPKPTQKSEMPPKPTKEFVAKKLNQEIAKAKLNAKPRFNASEAFMKFKGMVKRAFWKINPKKDNRGVMLLDNTFLEKLKSHAGNKDCRGKYLSVNLKSPDDINKLHEMFE